MRFASAVLTSTTFLLLSTGLFGQNSKVAPDLAALLNNPANPGQQVNVIVQLNPPGLLQTVTGLVGLLPGVNRLLYSLIPAVTQTLPLASILSLANLPNVKY